MAERVDVATGTGGVLVAYDDGPAGAPVVLWHHGSPHTGVPAPPLLEATRARGLRLVTYARPSYGGSTPRPGRDVISAAADVAAVLDALGVDRCVTVGASGGGPHALACAAALPEVVAVATFAGVAPFDGSDAWFAGMASDGALRAAARGRAARLAFAETDEFDPAVFVDADWAILEGPWGFLGQDGQAADTAGPDGLVDDDVAFTRPWGVDLGAVRVPAVVVQGERDRMIPVGHGRALAAAIPGAELRLEPDDGHVSVLRHLPDVLERLVAHL